MLQLLLNIALFRPLLPLNDYACMKMYLPVLLHKSLFFLVVSFACLTFVPKSVLGADDEQYTNCSRRFDCGNIQNIHYPFWGSDRPGYCGYPDPVFKLNCKEELAEISIMSTTYRVLQINNDSQILRVARADYLDDLCPPLLTNSTLDTSVLQYTSDTQNITLYYGCPIINNTATWLSSQFTCQIGVTVFGYYLTRNLSESELGPDASAITSSLESCNYTVSLPIFQSTIQSLEANPTAENLVGALGEGFGLLQRTANTTLCARCQESGGQCGSNSNFGSFTCYCPDQPYPDICIQGGPSRGNNLKLIIGLAVPAATLAVSIAVMVIFKLKRDTSSGNLLFFRRSKMNSDVKNIISKYGSLALKQYSYSEIKKITNSFREKLGQGGYGSVYKGKLPDGCLVGVKILTKSIGEGQEFINEVASISRTSHVNVVSLLGFCFESSRRALIYEFMPNGSLDKFISNRTSAEKSNRLDTKTLYEIAVGIARGLEYLHKGCNTRILHFDIKPNNILLDENFCPKISDFGLAKLCEGRESIISMTGGARGTFGYIAPEVFCRNFGGVSYKSDVYSYGMVVLEMVGQRKNVDVGLSQNSETYFPIWIYKHLEKAADLNLEGTGVEEEEMSMKMAIVSLWCVQTNPSDRPSMTKVIEMLQGSLESLEVPPKPFLSSPTGSPQSFSSSPSLMS